MLEFLTHSRMNPTGKVAHLGNIFSISPHVGGEVVKVMTAAEVFSDLPKAHDMAGLAKISNMMNYCIIYSLINWVCTWIRKPIKKIKETEYSAQRVEFMQKPISEENTCTCTFQLPHEWQISLFWHRNLIYVHRCPEHRSPNQESSPHWKHC